MGDKQQKHFIFYTVLTIRTVIAYYRKKQLKLYKLWRKMNDVNCKSNSFGDYKTKCNGSLILKLHTVFYM